MGCVLCNLIKLSEDQEPFPSESARQDFMNELAGDIAQNHPELVDKMSKRYCGLPGWLVLGVISTDFLERLNFCVYAAAGDAQIDREEEKELRQKLDELAVALGYKVIPDPPWTKYGRV